MERASWSLNNTTSCRDQVQREMGLSGTSLYRVELSTQIVCVNRFTLLSLALQHLSLKLLIFI